MRVALLIAGQPRTMEFCFPSLKKHILDVYHPDVFACSDAEPEKIVNMYNPVGFTIRDQDFIDKQIIVRRAKFIPPGGEVIPHKDLSIAWKVWCANEMKKEHELRNGFEYDVVLLTRFDVKFAYVQPIELPKPDTLYVPRIGAYWATPPDEPGIHWHGYSAHLCWMSSKVANKIASMYFDGTNIYQQACESSKEYGWVPEYTLKYFCEKNHINIEFVNIGMMLIRGTSEQPLSFFGDSLGAYPEYREATV